MEWTNLALTVIAGDAAHATAAQAWAAQDAAGALFALVAREARRTAARHGRLPRQARQDYLDAAPGKVIAGLCKRLRGRPVVPGEPGDDPALGYVRRALKNEYNEYGRRVARDAARAPLRAAATGEEPAEPMDAFPDAAARDALDAAAAREAESGPFAADDQARIDAWAPRDAVVLLGATALYRKLPSARWRSLLAACAIDAGDVPAGLADDPAARATLADLMGVGRNAIDKRISRSGHLLRDLRFVREALADAGGRRLAVA